MTGVSHTGNDQTDRWTFRTWFLPWLQLALVCAVAALRSPALPLYVCLLALVCLPILRGPLAHRRWTSWLVVAVCAIWWVAESASENSLRGYLELVRIGGWCLCVLGAGQILSLGRGGSIVLVSWCMLGATWAFGGGEGFAGAWPLLVQGILTIESLRRKNGRTGRSWVAAGFWMASLLVMGGVVVFQLSWFRSGGWGQRLDWQESSSRIKGFSTLSRLGSFGPSALSDRDNLVALRVWSDSPPTLMKGMIHDIYSNGSWLATRSIKFKGFEKMTLDHAQFCRDQVDPGAARGWASSPDDRVPVLFAPPGTGCVGVVADSLCLSSQGVFGAPPTGLGRGWFWYSTDKVDTETIPSERRVPSELVGLLDSAWSEMERLDPKRDIASLSEQDRVQLLSEWFQLRFQYDLDVPQEKGLDPLRVFFRSRKGYCEYFATAAVLLLRRAGVHARYVTGYSQPEAKGVGKWWLYHQGDAHAWVEWKPKQGNWTTFDPTPVAQMAHDKGERRWMRWGESLAGGAVYGWHWIRDGAWRSRLDGWQTRWEAWSGPLKGVGGWILAMGLGGLVIWKRRQTLRSGKRGEWMIRLERAESALRRQGHVRSRGETIRDFLTRLPENLDSKAMGTLRAYQDQRWKAK